MSIEVTIAELPAALTERPWGYLVTVDDGGRAHLVAVPTDWRAEALHMDCGARTRANAAARPSVTMVFPPVSPDGYSLIVDGEATVDDAGVSVAPSAAVLHRPART